MEAKRKISVRKILQLLLTLVVASGCIVAMVSASTIEGERPIKALPVIHIKNDRRYNFIEQKEVMDLAINNRHVDVMRTPVSKLDLKGIENAIKKDPWVADAQVYIDIDRMMHIYVTQRVPITRIFKQDGTSYYMDSTLHNMPLSGNYTYYTTVVTNAPEMGTDSAGMGLRRQIATIVHAIQADSFWNAQVSQVIMEPAGGFILMPVLGNQKILFGDTSRITNKFGNLLAFYKNVLNRIGWDKYKTLDVRFHDQVVAAPSLPYTGPVDKAVSKMNWITSIEVTEAQKMHEDSLREMAAKVARITVVKPSVGRKAAPEHKVAVPGRSDKAPAKNTKVAEKAKPATSDKKPVVATPKPKKDEKKAIVAKKHVDKVPETKSHAKSNKEKAPVAAAKKTVKKAPPAKVKLVKKEEKKDKKTTNKKAVEKEKSAAGSTAKPKYTYPEGKAK